MKEKGVYLIGNKAMAQCQCAHNGSQACLPFRFSVCIHAASNIDPPITEASALSKTWAAFYLI